MFPSTPLLSLIFIALAAVEASPLTRRTGKATLSFATKINERGALNIVEMDRARAHAMKQTAQLGKNNTSFSVTNTAVSYTAQVGVGNPATNYTLLIDTGSSNIFVGADKSYVKTSTSKDTGNGVAVSYGSGNFSGEEWLDTVTLAPGLVINQQSIGVANESAGFSNIDGILGVGPVDLTTNTVSNTNTVPTVSDNLFSQGMISEEVLGIYYVPVTQTNSTGMLTFGGYDNSVITSPVNYVPVTTTFPASNYWGINQTIAYGGVTIMPSTAGIVDTGTTLVMIPSDAFQQYQMATGGVLDSTTGLLSITPAQYAKLQSLTFNIGGQSYELSPNGQIWPRSLNSAIGGSANSIYLIVSEMASGKGGSGFDFINGFAFLERYYSVYDTTNQRVGFASTAYTNSTSN